MFHWAPPLWYGKYHWQIIWSYYSNSSTISFFRTHFVAMCHRNIAKQSNADYYFYWESVQHVSIPHVHINCIKLFSMLSIELRRSGETEIINWYAERPTNQTNVMLQWRAPQIKLKMYEWYSWSGQLKSDCAWMATRNIISEASGESTHATYDDECTMRWGN